MNMKMHYGVSVNSADIMDLLDDLQELADMGTALGDQIKKITSTICRFGLDTRGLEIPLQKTSFGEPANSIPPQKGETRRPAGSRSNIIAFPGLLGSKKSRQSASQKSHDITPILALPGIPLPANIPDYRFMLQRDGLILLAWDKRITEKGDRFTAYWVTSTGIPRFYASKPLYIMDFFNARPDHKSYAAEDGIEFYGQEAPEYLVHVAPELMMSSPRHGELRAEHIGKLQHQGYKADYDYKYLLKTEKKRTPPPKKHSGGSHGRAS